MTVQVAAKVEAETRRGTIAIGGSDISDVIEKTLRGRWTYETNFLRVMTGNTPSDAIIKVLPTAFIALGVSCDDLDLDMARLATSTGAEFDHAILPAIGFADRLRVAAERLSRGTAPKSRPQSDAQARIAGTLLVRLAEACPDSPYLAGLDARSGIDALVAALLLEAGVAPVLMPFVAIAARLPALAAIFLAERRERPNRFVGLAEGRLPALPETRALEAEAEALIAEGASFADLMIKVVLDRRIEGPERRIINAALISGAEYSETAASSSITRLMASTDASAVETYRSLISTFGYYHLGALKESARIIERAARSSDLEAAIEASIVYDAIEQPGKAPRGRVAGFGHRFQHRDPRAALLLEMCGRLFPGRFVETAAALDRRLFERRVGHINMDGIGAAMGLQVGFTAEVTSLLTLIARAPGIAKEYARVLAAPRTFSLKERAGLF